MISKIALVSEIFGSDGLKRHPAIAVFLVVNNRCDWSLVDEYENFPRDKYIEWRDKTMMNVLDKIKVDFDMLLPCNMIRFYDFLVNNVDIPDILEACENAYDIAHGSAIGTIRRLGWKYVKYDEETGLTEREWIMDKMDQLLRTPNNRLTYLKIMSYVYWQKRLRMVR